MQKDGRQPEHSGFKWSVAADVESVAWDPHTEYSFVVCDLAFSNFNYFMAVDAYSLFSFFFRMEIPEHEISRSIVFFRSVWKMAWFLALISVMLALIRHLSPSHVSLSMRMTKQFVQSHIIA